MNSGVNLVQTLIATAVTSVLLASCAVAPVIPEGAVEAREKLTQLQSNPDLAAQAPVAVREADLAVSVAEEPQVDKQLGAYQVYIADRKVEIARAQAETSRAEAQRASLSAQREQSRLDACTRGAGGNNSAAGRQENRRVEVIISNPPANLR